MTIMPGHEVEIIDLTQIVGEFEIPCFYDSWSNCGPRPAEWVMSVRCGCGVGVERLACQGCHDVLVATEECITCPACDEVYQPARRVFVRMDRL